jgi:signal transduction histidine kinase
MKSYILYNNRQTTNTKPKTYSGKLKQFYPALRINCNSKSHIFIALKVKNRAMQTNASAKEILHILQRKIIFIAILFTSIGLLIDTSQQLSAFKWMIKQIGDKSFLYLVHSSKAVILNTIVIVSILVLIYMYLRRKMSITKVTIFYAIISCVSTAIPYLWIIQKPEAVIGYLLKDVVFFMIVIFIVSTCTLGRYIYHIAAFVVSMYLAISIVSGNVFLQENMLVFLFLILGFSYCLWEKDKILLQIVTRQNEEKLKIEELSSFKENMNSMLFHDIKVPLNNIITLSGSNARQSNIIQIQNQAGHVKRMLENMIDIASSSETKLDIRPSVFKISDLLEYACKQSHYHAQLKEISIIQTFGHEDFKMICDREMIERALINVIENAIKYSPEKGKIKIKAEKKDGYVYISIIDEGPGIKEDEKDKIFNLFYSSDYKGGKKSSGIGLAFCKMAVELHGGNLKLISPENGGSEFVFFLPCLWYVSNQKQNLENSEMKEFSEDVLNLFKPLVSELNKLKYYQTSEIYNLLNKVSFTDWDSQNKEIEIVRTMALSCDPDRYSTLLNQLI